MKLPTDAPGDINPLPGCGCMVVLALLVIVWAVVVIISGLWSLGVRVL